jgi:hypothetical protein
VELILDSAPEFIAVPEPSDHQIVPPLRLRTANRPAHHPLAARPPGEVLALEALPVGLPHGVWRRVPMALIGPPAVRVIPRDATWLHQGLKAQKALVLAPAKHIGPDLPRVVIDGVPQPAPILS